jgi:hemerythrin-like domain-containing protein
MTTLMPKMMQPLRDEHVELLPHVEHLRTTAEAIGLESFDSISQQVQQAHWFLSAHLLPHAQAEEAALYHVVAAMLGAPEATATMCRDHAAIGEMVAELGRLRDELAREGRLTQHLAHALRRVLYGLYTLVTVHLAKEEDVYLPLLDEHLTPVEADEMFRGMEAAVAQARSRFAA